MRRLSQGSNIEFENSLLCMLLLKKNSKSLLVCLWMWWSILDDEKGLLRYALHLSVRMNEHWFLHAYDMYVCWSTFFTRPYISLFLKIKPYIIVNVMLLCSLSLLRTRTANVSQQWRAVMHYRRIKLLDEHKMTSLKNRHPKSVSMCTVHDLILNLNELWEVHQISF